MMWPMWIDQEREKSMCSLYEVTLSMVCDEILRKGKSVIARRPSTISFVFEVFISIPF